MTAQDTAPTGVQAATGPSMGVRVAGFVDLARRVLSPRSTGVYIDGESIHFAVARHGIGPPRVLKAWTAGADGSSADPADPRTARPARAGRFRPGPIIHEEIARAEKQRGPSSTVISGVPLEQSYLDVKDHGGPLPNDPAERDKALEALVPATFGGGSPRSRPSRRPLTSNRC